MVRIDERVSEHEVLGRDSAINQGVTVPGREGACPTCGRMEDCCCPHCDQGEGRKKLCQTTRGSAFLIGAMIGGGQLGPMSGKALARMIEDVRRGEEASE